MEKVMNGLYAMEKVRVLVHGEVVTVQYDPSSGFLYCETLVYQGENFIPIGVRSAIQESLGWECIRTKLIVNEKKYAIQLVFCTQTHNLTAEPLMELLSTFSEIAIAWKLRLDERGQKDLVYIHSKR